MFLIQTTDRNGRWYVLGSENFEHVARAKIRHHQNLFPHHPVRLVNHATQKAVEIVKPRREPTRPALARFYSLRTSIQTVTLCATICLVGYHLYDYCARLNEAEIVQACRNAPLDQSCIKRIYAAIRLMYPRQ